MKTTVIIPTLNEVESIERVLNEIPKDKVDEVFLIDGHSKDGTVELAGKLGYRVVFQEKKGFGNAISEGIEKASGDVVVVLNGDGSMNPKDIPLLVEKIEEGNDLVLASRYLPGGGSDDDTLIHYFGNKCFTFLTNLLYGTGVSDTLYFFIAIRKSIFDKVKPENQTFGYCIELPIRVRKAGFKVGEIPSFERARFGGEAKVNAMMVGPDTLWTLLKQWGKK